MSLLCREDLRRSRGDNDVDLEPDELGRDLDEALGASFRPAILNRDGATLYPAKFTQSLRKGGDKLALGRTRALARKSDGLQLPRLLRARRERPRSGRAAEQRDERAATWGEAGGVTRGERMYRACAAGHYREPWISEQYFFITVCLTASSEGSSRMCPRRLSPPLAENVACCRLALCPQRRSSDANSLQSQNSAGFPQIRAILQRDNLPRHF